jgi:hypothetical protein
MHRTPEVVGDDVSVVSDRLAERRKRVSTAHAFDGRIVSGKLRGPALKHETVHSCHETKRQGIVGTKGGLEVATTSQQGADNSTSAAAAARRL